MRKLVLALVLGLPAAPIAAQQPMAWTAASIEWQEVFDDGTRYSVLECQWCSQ